MKQRATCFMLLCCLAYSSGLKTEAATGSSATSVDFLRPTPEGRILHSRCEDLKSYNYFKVTNDLLCSHEEMSKFRPLELKLKCDEGVNHCCPGNYRDLVNYCRMKIVL